LLILAVLLLLGEANRFRKLGFPVQNHNLKMKKRRNKKKISIVSVLPPNENTSKSQKKSVDHCRKKKKVNDGP